MIKYNPINNSIVDEILISKEKIKLEEKLDKDIKKYK